VAEPEEPDPARPTQAGIYDYLLGGEHYSAADQAAAEQAMALTPANRTEVIENRAFLRRAVHYLASRGLLHSPDTAVIVRDARRPAEIIGDPQTRRLIDWSRPVAVLLVSILHFIPDEEDPAGIVAAFREQMAPGSYLALSHGVVLDDPEFVGQVARNWDRAGSGVTMRTRAEVAGFLAGFDLVPPGLVTTVEWGTDRPPTTGPGAITAAVGALSG
jgi:hypothetical protein